MVAALTVRAITVAVSTSRSYGAFVAATTALEGCAVVLADLDHIETRSPKRVRRLQEAIDNGSDVGLSADTGATATGKWPSNIHDACPLESPSTSADTCPACPLTPPNPKIQSFYESPPPANEV